MVRSRISWVKHFIKTNLVAIKNCSYTRANDGYAGLSNREILKVTMENEKFSKFSVKFTNKARPRPVRVKRIQEQHQVDLVDMTGMKVNYKWKTY